MDKDETAARLASIETHLKDVDNSIESILAEQKEARQRDMERQVDLKVLATNLEGLLGRLDELTKKRFAIANIVIATCGVLVLVFNILITLPAIKNANRIAETQMSAQFTSTP